MNSSIIEQQNILLQNRERIFSEMKKYPNVLHVGVGAKEIKHQLTGILCYRVYVHQKKPLDALQQHERIPSSIDGFIIDVLEYGEIAEAAGPVRDDEPYRPLKGGIQIKNDLYTDIAERGGGTLGCLVLMNDGTGKIVGLTNQHVVAYNTEDSHPEISNKIGQPWRHKCCCCFIRNIVGNVLDARKDDKIDCAIIEFNDDIVKGIKDGGTINEIAEIGLIKGTVVAFQNMPVKKRGARTRLTKGTVVDVAFDKGQVLIAPSGDDPVFADFGDSGSIVVDDQNQVVGLLWGIKRNRLINPGQPTTIVTDSIPLDPRTHGVVTPIAAVEAAMNIKIPVGPAVVPTITIHPNDTKTHLIPSSLPADQNPKKHFVTAKGEGDVILSVTFDQAIDPHRVSWISDNAELFANFPGPSGDNTTVTIKRKTLFGEKALVTLMVDNFPVEKVFVWVVWTALASPRIQPEYTKTINANGTTLTQSFNMIHLIQPIDIVNEDMDHNDLPDLRGANKTPPPNVPDTDTGVFNKGVDLSGGAIHKWDASVRLRCTGTTSFVTGGFDDNLPNYPSVDIVGNYDTTSNPVDGTPYSNDDLGEVAAIISDTTISYNVKRNFGFEGETIVTKIQIQHFARLELDGHWYLISDPYPRRIIIELIKRSEIHENVDYDGDGVLGDFDWIEVHDLKTDDNNDDFP